MAYEAVAATLDRQRRLRLPKEVAKAIGAMPGKQLMFYYDKEKGIAVIIPANRAFKSLKELWEGAK